MKSSPCLRWAALATALVFAAQLIVPPASLAFDETLPGGTSPGGPPPPPGKENQGLQKWLREQWEKLQRLLDPVDVSLGDFLLTRQDVFLPGRGLSVGITLTYRSRSAYNGPFGYGWDMSYNRRIRRLANNNVIVLRGNNRRDEFTFSTPNSLTPPSGVYDTLMQNADGTYTLTSKHGDKELYDANGNLTRTEDRNGNALTFTYDPAGVLPITGTSDYFVNQTTGVIARDYRLTQITDTAGRAIDFAYTAEGRLSTITHAGRTIRYSYDAGGSGDLLQVTDALANITKYSYTKHNLETITDAKGQVYLTNVYDAASDRVTSQTYGTGTSTMTYGTDASGNAITEVTDRRGFRTRFTFDSQSHITKQEEFTDGNPVGEPVSYVTQYEYNAAGERTRTLFPRGNSTEFTYDAMGNLLEIRRKKLGTAKGVADPSDIVTTFTYESKFNFVKSATNPRGNVTTYTYDYELGEPAKGNARKITFPAVGGQTIQATFTYNAYGQVETVTDPNGNVTKYTYDPTTGYLTQATQGFGTTDASTATLAYDSVGNITSATSANGQTSTFEYNLLNQLVKTTSPAPFNFVTYLTYDANGNVIQTDQQAKAGVPGSRPVTGTVSATDDWQSSVFTYTSLDQVGSVTDDLGNVTRFTYDANGNRISVQDAKLNTTTSEYDDRNLFWKVIDANGAMAESRYDANGSLASIKDANGNVTTYAYDDFDRLIRMTYANSSFEQLSYDVASNVASRLTPAGQTITYTYDALNRLITKVTPQETTNYTYDLGSRLTNVADADATVAYTYDALNRSTQVTTTPTGLAATSVRYTYDKLGLRTKLTYPDSSFITYEYDALNRLTTIKDSTNLALASYTYDALSRRTQLQLANGNTTTYAFDAMSRLTSLQSPVGTWGYTYDAIGNRTSMTNPAGTHVYSYDKLSQLTGADYPVGYAFADTTFALDPLGNRTQVASSAGPVIQTVSYSTNNLNQYTAVGTTAPAYDLNGNLTNDGANGYTYDAENRLIQATTASSTATYTYDPLGRRLSKTVGGVTTRFLYDGDQLLAETNASGNITARYTYGPSIDEPIRIERGSTIAYYHFDGLGSVVALTDTAGSVLERYTYDVYGQFKITDAAGSPLTASTVGNRFTFTGRELDSETGLYYYRARHYSPTLGRFLQRDPVGYSAGLNLYTYVDNNPLNWVDPLGLAKRGKWDWAGFRQGLLDLVRGLPFGLALYILAPELAVGVGAYFLAQSTFMAITGRDFAGHYLSGYDLSRATGQAAGGWITVGWGAFRGNRGSAEVAKAPEARGGTYLLRNPETGEVMRTGRTNDLLRREGEHYRDPATERLSFEVDKRTDVYAEQRGREQIIHSRYQPLLNKIRPISAKNPQLQEYLDAAEGLGD